ncbi:MAG: protein kinase [Anaerolineae bacterium]|nr:protein kinase [Anaerolineae bacterium]
MLQEGTLLQQDRYRILRILGQGGMGAVYEAYHQGLEMPVAIKEMIPQPGLAPKFLDDMRAQFKREAVILARLSHHHLVHVIDSFEEGGNAYLVMEKVDGESMAERIVRAGALPESLVLQWAHQLLDALAYCHGQGIIHRDIKPHNIIIHPDGRAILVDFGLVKLWDPYDPRTKTVMRGMGTPEYAPPEQYDAEAGHTDARSDIYSLGATLYHALAGQAPPTATRRVVNPEALLPVRALIPTVTERTEAVLLQALELRPIQRFQSAREMSLALRGETDLSPVAGMMTAQVAPTGTKIMPKSDTPRATIPDTSTEETAIETAADTKGRHKWFSVVAFILGLFGLLSTFVIPFCNLPFPLAGIVLGVMGRRTQHQRLLALFGIILSIMTLVLQIIMAIATAGE